MKKTLIILIFAIVASSCSKSFLNEEPKGKLASDGYFTNKATLDMAVTGLYKGFANTGYQDHWDCMFLGADDVTTRSGSNKQDFRDYDQFSTTRDVNTRNRDAWADYYSLIASANFIINGYQDATDATQQERDYAVAQAYFMRAYANYFIVRIWNSAPLVTTNEVNTAIQKSSPEEFYALILSDLQKAEAMLPDKWTTAPLAGKGVTNGAAKSLLASVYLTMTGYPIKDASKYTLAAEKAKEVIDNAGKYGYSLMPNYADLWLDKPINTELVLGCFYNNTTVAPNYRAPYPSQPEDEGGWDDYFAEINFFNAFPAGPRKDATYQTVITKKKGTVISKIPWQQGVQKHPYFKKMRYSNGDTPENYDPLLLKGYNSSRTNQIIRFAEVKLIYAEAHAMAASPDASAYKEVNDIRKRAGLPELTAGLGQIAFRDSVVAERGWEFAGNEFCSRWYDLVRLEMVEKANENRANNPKELPLIQTPTKADYFSPIPQGDRLINPNLNP